MSRGSSRERGVTEQRRKRPEVRVSPDGRSVAFRLPDLVGTVDGPWFAHGPLGERRADPAEVARWEPMLPVSECVHVTGVVGG